MKTRKLITAILIFAVIFIGALFLNNNVDAASLGYLTITKERTVDRNYI